MSKKDFFVTRRETNPAELQFEYPIIQCMYLELSALLDPHIYYQY